MKEKNDTRPPLESLACVNPEWKGEVITLAVRNIAESFDVTPGHPTVSPAGKMVNWRNEPTTADLTDVDYTGHRHNKALLQKISGQIIYITSSSSRKSIHRESVQMATLQTNHHSALHPLVSSLQLELS